MGGVATVLDMVLVAAATGDPATPFGSSDITSLVGLLNYGVLGVLTVGFIRGWVVSPRERDRLLKELDEAKQSLARKDEEIARLNKVIQENLQATTATMDKQIELAIARSRAGGSTRGDSG